MTMAKPHKVVQNEIRHFPGGSSALTVKKMLANRQKNTFKTRKHCPS